MSSLWVNEVKHHTTGFNNVVRFTDGAGTENGTLCRAWVLFNGTYVSGDNTFRLGSGIHAAFNVTSVTDNGIGNYTVNFTNAMPNANYAGFVEASVAGVVNNSWQSIMYLSTRTTSSVLIRSHGDPPNGAVNDKDNVSVGIFC
jgi:hypothetical protein